MRRPELHNWIPVGLLGVGCALLLLARQQEVVPLVAPLDTTVPATLLDLPSRDQEVSRTFSFCTPIVLEIDGKTQIISPGSAATQGCT